MQLCYGDTSVPQYSQIVVNQKGTFMCEQCAFANANKQNSLTVLHEVSDVEQRNKILVLIWPRTLALVR